MEEPPPPAPVRSPPLPPNSILYPTAFALDLSPATAACAPSLADCAQPNPPAQGKEDAVMEDAPTATSPKRVAAPEPEPELPPLPDAPKVSPLPEVPPEGPTAKKHKEVRIQCQVCQKSIPERGIESHYNLIHGSNGHSSAASAAPPSPRFHAHPYTLSSNFCDRYGPLLKPGVEGAVTKVVAHDRPMQLQSADPLTYGDWRGIQGENNSCYLDATLLALFGLRTDLDFMLLPRASPLAPAAEELRVILWGHIVGPLRERHFVGRDAMGEMRIRLNRWLDGNLVTKAGACRERDVDELLSALFSVLAVPPLVRLRHGKRETSDVHILQLLCDASLGSVMHLDQLLVASMAAQDLHFVDTPRLLLVQVPRYGKERVFDRVFPSPTLILPEGGGTLHLTAALCIGLSHFVAFVRSAEGAWYMFDSMADRIGQMCVPRIASVPEVDELLSASRPADIAAIAAIAKRTPDNQHSLAYRLVTDCYMCIYAAA